MTMRVDWKRGCFWGFAAFVVSAPLIYFWLRANTPAADALPWVTLGAAAALAIAALNVIVAADVLRQRRLVSAGAPPTEGEWGAFSGTIDCTKPLHGPMTGAPVALYSYAVVESKTSRGSGPTSSAFFKGLAMAPTMLRTRFGSMPLSEFPDMALQPAVLSLEEALRHFLPYRESTPFSLAPTAGGEATDADPLSSRLDIQVWKSDPDWQRSTLIETSIAPGEEVVVFGAYLNGRGIVSSPSGERPVLYRREEVVTDLKKNFRDSVSSVIFFALVAIATVAGYQMYAS